MPNLSGGLRDVRRRAWSLAGSLPVPRRRRRSLLPFSVPAVALAGLAAAAGLLMWDGRRRTAVRQRLEKAADTVGSSADRVASTTLSGARGD